MSIDGDHHVVEIELPPTVSFPTEENPFSSDSNSGVFHSIKSYTSSAVEYVKGHVSELCNSEHTAVCSGAILAGGTLFLIAMVWIFIRISS